MAKEYQAKLIFSENEEDENNLLLVFEYIFNLQNKDKQNESQIHQGNAEGDANK
jgi:hypothetical protein